MKIAIEERDETQQYRPVPLDQFQAMVKSHEDRICVYVPNLCGGETRITIFRSSCPNGNPENLERLKDIPSKEASQT